MLKLKAIEKLKTIFSIVLGKLDLSFVGLNNFHCKIRRKYIEYTYYIRVLYHRPSHRRVSEFLLHEGGEPWRVQRHALGLGEGGDGDGEQGEGPHGGADAQHPERQRAQQGGDQDVQGGEQTGSQRGNHGHAQWARISKKRPKIDFSNIFF